LVDPLEYWKAGNLVVESDKKMVSSMDEKKVVLLDLRKVFCLEYNKVGSLVEKWVELTE
jgi:hypothetical protein